MNVMKSMHKSEIFYLALAAFFPMAVLLIWLWHNFQLPGNDAANYMMTATEIYHRYTEKGIWDGIISSYLVRGWRPILFPVFSLPFMLISHGSLYCAYYGVAFTFLLLSVLYVYYYFRLILDKGASVVATSIVISLPLLLGQHILLYAESAFFPCFIGSLYHLIKSNFFKIQSHSIGFVVFTSLSFMIRPVETVTQLFFIMSVFLYVGYQRKFFLINELIDVLIIFVSSLLIFIMVCGMHHFHNVLNVVPRDNLQDIKITKLLFFAMLITGSIIGLRVGLDLINRAKKNKNVSSYLIPSIFILSVLVLFWFLPAAYETFQWIYSTSIGDVAQSTGSLSGSKFSLSVLKIYVEMEGNIVVICTLILAILSIYFLGRNQLKSIINSQPFIYLLLTIPFPLWESFYTVQVVTRKLSLAFPALIMALLFLGLAQGRFWRFRFVLILALSLIQFIGLVTLIFQDRYHNHHSYIKQFIGYYIPQPVRQDPTPHDILINFLNERADKLQLKSIAIEVNPGTPDARHFVESEPVDPFLLSTMLVSAQAKYSVGYPYIPIYDVNSLKNIKNHYDAILLSDSQDKMKVSNISSKNYSYAFNNETNPSLKLFDQFLYLYSSGKLKDADMMIDKCIIITSIGYGNYMACLLVPIQHG